MIRPGRGVADRQHGSVPAFLYTPPPAPVPWHRTALRIVGVLVGAWLIAVAFLWSVCLIAGGCR